MGTVTMTTMRMMMVNGHGTMGNHGEEDEGKGRETPH